jgi:hypothetical protein
LAVGCDVHSYVGEIFVEIRHVFRAASLLALAATCLAAFAQAPAAPSSLPETATSLQNAQEVVNPRAGVPAVLYRSVFVDTPTGVETEEVDWKKANAEVGQFKRGHVDILQWEAKQKAKP